MAARGWVMLTKDKNIRRRGHEREAALTAAARIFTLHSGNLRGRDTVALFLRHLDAMEQVALALRPPFIAVVGPTGIEIVRPAPDTE